MQNSHYIGLMVIPVVASGFRYGARGIALVVLTVSALTFLYLYIYFHDHGPGEMAEYFEAANVVLIYVVVATSIAFLVFQLRRDRARLAASLSELEETRDRLVAEEKLAAVGRLSSAIAHEIRNPVGMIVSSLALVAGGEPERRDEMCGIAMKEARRLEALTTDFLTYARPRKLDRRETGLCGTLQYVVALVSAKAAECGVELSIDCPQDRSIAVDPFQIHQVLLNFVANALESTRRGGRIVLGARAGNDRHADIFVENSGPPLPADVVSRLFEPFFTTKPAGTGLGLAIAQGIARAHGGEVLLESNAPARVRFTLRIAVDQPVEAPEKEPAWHAY
jgi:signal transduction histidine kinase